MSRMQNDGIARHGRDENVIVGLVRPVGLVGQVGQSRLGTRGSAAKLAAAAMIMALIAGCSTEIKVNGNYNSIDTSPAKYAGYGSTVDVLKGMSLPSLSLGSGKEEKEQTDVSGRTPDQGNLENLGNLGEAPAAQSDPGEKNGVLAEVEAPEAKVTEGKVEVKAEQGTANERE